MYREKKKPENCPVRPAGSAAGNKKGEVIIKRALYSFQSSDVGVLDPVSCPSVGQDVDKNKDGPVDVDVDVAKKNREDLTGEEMTSKVNETQTHRGSIHMHDSLLGLLL